MANINALFLYLHHQDNVTSLIKVGERGQVVRELVAEYNSQDCHDGTNPGLNIDWAVAILQLLEQYFTFCQSPVYFLRQVKGRPQIAQVLVGRSAFRRVTAMRSPRHRLPAPVEEPAAGFRRKLFDDRAEMAGRYSGRMDLVGQKTDPANAPSRRLTMIVAQKPAQPLAAAHGSLALLARRSRKQQDVALPLMNRSANKKRSSLVSC